MTKCSSTMELPVILFSVEKLHFVVVSLAVKWGFLIKLMHSFSFFFCHYRLCLRDIVAASALSVPEGSREDERYYWAIKWVLDGVSGQNLSLRTKCDTSAMQNERIKNS